MSSTNHITGNVHIITLLNKKMTHLEDNFPEGKGSLK